LLKKGLSLHPLVFPLKPRYDDAFDIMPNGSSGKDIQSLKENDVSNL
jgi:hypothetical protein